MSGFAYNLKYSTAMTPVAFCTDDEAAGKIGKFLGVIAAVVVPFAAPAIFGAIAGSGFLGSTIAGLATSGGFLGTVANVVGSGVVGALMNAGAAYVGGARGGDVWKAAGAGFLQGGMGGLSRGMNPGKAGAGIGGIKPPNPAVLNSGGTIGKVATNVFGNTVNAAGQTITQTAGLVSSTTPTVSSGIMGGIRQAFGNLNMTDLNRIGAAITNAAINGQSMGRLDNLVEQQKAELAQLQAQDQAAYQQRIQVAQQILSDADRMDPAWMGRIRMADVAGIEANQYRQAMRNIATTKGNLNGGEKNAYERSAALHAGRSKALAYNEGYGQGVNAQAQLRTQGMAGLTGPDPRYAQMGWEMDAARERARREADYSTWGGLFTALGSTHRKQPTSPEQPGNGQDEEQGTFGSFTNPFGGGG